MREPDTNVMRATYATAATYRQSPDPERAAKFDAWLDQVRAAARREGQAEAWADAVASAYLHETENFISIKHDPNPYRREASDE